jgi:hypothetical protein
MLLKMHPLPAAFICELEIKNATQKEKTVNKSARNKNVTIETWQEGSHSPGCRLIRQ